MVISKDLITMMLYAADVIGVLILLMYSIMVFKIAGWRGRVLMGLVDVIMVVAVVWLGFHVLIK